MQELYQFFSEEDGVGSTHSRCFDWLGIDF